FEVKYKNNKKIPIGRSLHNFIAKYDPEDAFIITPKSKSSIKIKNTWVRIIPFWELYSIKI
ncbi:MAG: ATPase, partial [Actinobacteria bacterium]|nr:ATPase [Actinomycetota bacterium]